MTIAVMLMFQKYVANKKLITTDLKQQPKANIGFFNQIVKQVFPIPNGCAWTST